MAIFSEKSRKKAFSVLGEGTSFNGTLKFSQAAEINGKFSGRIDGQGPLYIRKAASCNVDYINAPSIVVEGDVTGKMHGEERIELRPGSSVHGNISAAAVKIEDDVLFEGNVEMLGGKEDVDIFLARPDILKGQLKGDLEPGAEDLS